MAGLVFGVMSRVGNRAARSRTRWVISAAEAVVPIASGASRCRPPGERSVTITPPQRVIHSAAVATSASTAARPPRLSSKSSAIRWVRPALVYRYGAAGRAGSALVSFAESLNVPVSGL